MKCLSIQKKLQLKTTIQYKISEYAPAGREIKSFLFKRKNLLSFLIFHRNFVTNKCQIFFNQGKYLIQSFCGLMKIRNNFKYIILFPYQQKCMRIVLNIAKQSQNKRMLVKRRKKMIKLQLIQQNLCIFKCIQNGKIKSLKFRWPETKIFLNSFLFRVFHFFLFFPLNLPLIKLFKYELEMPIDISDFTSITEKYSGFLILLILIDFLLFLRSANQVVQFEQKYCTMQVGESSNQEHSASHDQSGPLAVFFIFFGLLCGGLLREVNKKFGIPYTPMLLVFGICLGYWRDSLGVLGQSSQIMQSMSPHMILLVFIPILIFESAFNCDWHVFRKSIVSILLLAGPGVLWGAIIIAFFLKILLGYGDDDLSWFQACALGCVLSATDPVAVVALLKDLGASVKFNILVEGQSLLNDGTAMVFFMLFMSLVKGEDTTVTGVIANFVRVSLGGPLLGLVFGVIVSFWMKKIIRDTVLSVIITFIGTFLCFWVAEFTWVKVSGILSVVSLGLYFSAVGKRKIYPQSQHALHNVWAAIQYGSQTIIFILTGVIVGVQMVDGSTIGVGDWIKMLIFWVLMIIARIIMVFTFYPALKNTGYGITMKEMIILIYGGLRGALGMCLSLFVAVDQSLRLRFRELTVFYMCGMAMLTIIVNGLTCSKLVNYVQMIKVPQIKIKLLQRCLKRVLQSTQDRLKQLKADPTVSHAKWREVQQIAEVKTIGRTFHQKRGSILAGRDSLLDFNRVDMLEQIRFRFTRYLQRTFWQYYQEGQLSEESINVLSSTCNIVGDELTVKLRYFDILSGFFNLEEVGWYTVFKNWPIIGRIANQAILSKIYMVYEVSAVMAEACEEVSLKFQESFPARVDHLHSILEEVKENIQSANAYISELQNSYPSIIQSVHTQRATSILLKSKKNRLKQFHQQGYVDQKDYAQLRREIDHILVKVHSQSLKDDVKFSEVIMQCPLFSSLSQQQMVTLRMKARERSYVKGNNLLQRNSSVPSAFIIISGSVRQQFEDFYLTRSIGNIINPFDFTYKESSKCQAQARNNVRVLEIEEGVIGGLLNNNQDFKKLWYKSLFLYCIHHFRGLEGLMKDTSEKHLRRFIQAGQVILLNSRQTVELPKGGFIFAGQLECQRNTFTKGAFIPYNKTLKSLTDSILMKFKLIHEGQNRKSVINEAFTGKDE